MSRKTNLAEKINVVRLSKTSDLKLIFKNIKRLHPNIWTIQVEMLSVRHVVYADQKDMTKKLFDDTIETAFRGTRRVKTS